MDIDRLMKMGMMPWVDPFKLTKESEITGVPKENMRDVQWWEKNIPCEDQVVVTDSEIKKLSKKARGSVLPCACRGQVWLHVTGGAHRKAKAPLAFEESCQTLPEFWKHSVNAQPPNFGASIDLTQFCLNADGVDKYARVLHGIAEVYPEVTSFCPWLPMAVASCLHWMDERDTFALASALIREPSPLLMSRLSSWLMLETFCSVSRTHLSGEVAMLYEHCGVETPIPLHAKNHPLGGVVKTWIGNLKFWPLMRLMDVFCIEGDRIFYQTGLVLIEKWASSMAMSAGARKSKNGGNLGPKWYLPSSAARAVENPDTFMADCSKYNVTTEYIAKLKERSYSLAHAAIDKSGSYLAVGESLNDKGKVVYERPLIAHESQIVEHRMWGALWPELPSRFRIKTLHKIFSTETDGYSLATLYDKCEYDSPTLLLVSTTDGQAFGAFLSYPWLQRHKHLRGYFGTGDSFIFSLVPSLVVYPWVGMNRSDCDFDDDASGENDIPSLFMHGGKDILAVGGGGTGHAIQLDRELMHGHSSPCTTFANPSLCAIPIEPTSNRSCRSSSPKPTDSNSNSNSNSQTPTPTPPPPPKNLHSDEFTCRIVEVWVFKYGGASTPAPPTTPVTPIPSSPDKGVPKSSHRSQSPPMAIPSRTSISSPKKPMHVTQKERAKRFRFNSVSLSSSPADVESNPIARALARMTDRLSLSVPSSPIHKNQNRKQDKQDTGAELGGPGDENCIGVDSVAPAHPTKKKSTHRRTGSHPLLNFLGGIGGYIRGTTPSEEEAKTADKRPNCITSVPSTESDTGRARDVEAELSVESEFWKEPEESTPDFEDHESREGMGGEDEDDLLTAANVFSFSPPPLATPGGNTSIPPRPTKTLFNIDSASPLSLSAKKRAAALDLANEKPSTTPPSNILQDEGVHHAITNLLGKFPKEVSPSTAPVDPSELPI